MQFCDFLGLLANAAQVDWVNDETKGYIVWRRGTGGNVELLHIHAYERRKGFGRSLLSQMLLKLQDDPPSCSVYGFTRVNNLIACQFYASLGFSVQPVLGVYAEGDAALFSASYKELLCKLSLNGLTEATSNPHQPL